MKMQNSDFSLKIEEVKCALSVLILSRYHNLPSKGMYWKQKRDVHGGYF